MDDIELQTDRLRLRRLTPADAGRLAAIADDIRIARNLTPAFPHPYTLDDAVEFIASRPQGLGVEPVDGDNGIVGMVGGSERAASSRPPAPTVGFGGSRPPPTAGTRHRPES